MNKLLKFAPKVLALGLGVFAVAIITAVIKLTPWDAVSFAVTDPQAVRWLKTNLDARELNARRELKEELIPDKTATGSVSFYVSPVAK